MPPSESFDRSAAYGGYKYQWARYIGKQSLNADIGIVKEKLNDLNRDPSNLPTEIIEQVAGIPKNPQDRLLREIARKTKSITFGKAPEVPGQFNVGIVGSGIAGLFTAALIDELNHRIPGLKIEYDILEAGSEKRLGGRLYTHRFEEDPLGHQYYDVGAMRFPDNEVMERTFRLFDYLDIEKVQEGTKDKDKPPCPRLIPYYLKDEDNVCPTYFNHVRYFGKVDFKGNPDPYRVNTPMDDPDRIEDSIMTQNPNDIVDIAIKDLKDELRKRMDMLASKKNSFDPDSVDPGWEALMKADFLTTREFFRRKGEIEESKLKGLGYNFNTIEWLETYAYATGWYNQSLAETVLESLDFDPPKKKEPVEGEEPPKDEEPEKNYWWSIEGGTQLLAKKLADKLKKQPEFNKKVTAINTDLKEGYIELKIKPTKPDDWDPKEEFKPDTEDRTYFTVFNSTTLGALQKMDLSKAKLLYGTKQAIRSLNYGASCKVGIQFKEMWWQKEPWNIKKGGLGKTDLPLRVCVYPSYNIHDEGKGVLLCSYSWAQDAQRIASLISPHSPQNESELIEVMLSNLAQLHAKPARGWPYEKVLKHIKGLYMTHHAYDWYHDPNMSGAFGYFGPGQFSKMWPQIVKPNEWLFLVGEAASAHHGWIVGALESVVRAMHQLFVMLKNEIEKLDGKFAPYDQAIKFLEGPDDPKDKLWKLPFVGLPREIPKYQIGTEKDAPIQLTPKDDSIDLSFVAAQVILSFYQLVLEVEREQEAARKLVLAEQNVKVAA